MSSTGRVVGVNVDHSRGGRVIVVPHQPRWRAMYTAESVRITVALGACLVRLHHIGSTAIPAIRAKPIIDCLMDVRDIDELDEKDAVMDSLGYEAMGEFGIPGRRFFRKDDAFGVRRFHLHAFEHDSQEIVRHLAFRDYLIAHPPVARAYSQLKVRLAARHPHDIQAYMDGKDAFVKAVEAKGLAWGGELAAK